MSVLIASDKKTERLNYTGVVRQMERAHVRLKLASRVILAQLRKFMTRLCSYWTIQCVQQAVELAFIRYPSIKALKFLKIYLSLRVMSTKAYPYSAFNLYRMVSNLISGKSYFICEFGLGFFQTRFNWDSLRRAELHCV